MESSKELIDYLISEISQEYRNWLELVTALTPEQVSKRPEEGWSVIDTLVHVTAWQKKRVEHRGRTKKTTRRLPRSAIRAFARSENSVPGIQ